MLRFDTVLFDLDGTLTDPAVGITNAVAYALEKFGITPPPREELLCFIGPPLAASFAKYFGMDEPTSYQAVDVYREYFAPKGIFENEVYAGVPELLAALKKAGMQVVLATSKPEVFAVRILEHFGLASYFDAVCGSELDGRRVDKAEVVAEALRRCPGARPVMVGDREHDVLGARQNGLPAVGVLFGYGSREELETAGAIATVETVAALGDVLLADAD